MFPETFLASDKSRNLHYLFYAIQTPKDMPYRDKAVQGSYSRTFLGLFYSHFPANPSFELELPLDKGKLPRNKNVTAGKDSGNI